MIEGAYFTGLGISSGVGNPGGPGFTTTDTADPLLMRFQVGANGRRSGPGAPLSVNFNP